MLCGLVNTSDQKKSKEPSSLLLTWQILLVLGRMALKKERWVDVHEWLHPHFGLWH